MEKFQIQKLSPETQIKIINLWGDWVEAYGCLHTEEGSLTLVALRGEEPIGFLSVYPARFPEPLEAYGDAYIDDLEVLETYRRQGVASALLRQAEAWAKEQGFRQLRSWSSEDKREALSLWHALGYGLCPAVMRGESVVSGFKGKAILGFYVVKPL